MTRLDNFRRLLIAAACVAAAAPVLGCSPKRLAEESIADALAANGDTFQTDDDPQLVGAAIPFGLKLMESLLADLPKHQGLLTSACSGFTGYGYAYVQEDADEASGERAQALRERARRLFLRANAYCLRGLDSAHPGLAEALTSGDARRIQAALAETRKEDVALLYWTAASWGLAIGDSLNDLALISRLPAVAAAAERARTLDPTWSDGTLYDFFITLDGARGTDQGGGPQKAKADFDRSLELSRGTRLGASVSYAEAVLIPAQDRKGFEALLKQVLAYDIDDPGAVKNRLANLLARRRARWLKSRADELFL